MIDFEMLTLTYRTLDETLGAKEKNVSYYFKSLSYLIQIFYSHFQRYLGPLVISVASAVYSRFTVSPSCILF